MSINNQLLQVLENETKKVTDDMHTALIAVIMSVDNTKRTCRIKFLNKVIKSVKGQVIQTIPAELNEVPIPPIFSSGTWELWAKYEVGDKVIVQIMERPFYEPFVSDDIAEQQMNSRMQLGFSVILKPIPPKMLTETQPSSSAFLIHNKKNGDSFEFTESGVLNINTGTVNINAGTVNISGDLNVTGVSTAKDHVSSGISGKGHVHKGVTSGSSTTGGAQ